MAPQPQINPDTQTDTLTPEAKLEACKQRVSPGFLRSTALANNESRDEFVDLLHALIAQYDPATITEQILVEKMLHNQWLSLRAFRIQSVMIGQSTPLCSVPHGFGVMIRAQTAGDRGFHRAHSELVKAQKERQKSAIGFESQKAAPPVEAQLQSPQSPLKPAAPEPPARPETVVSPAAPQTISEIAVEIAGDPGKLRRAA